MTAATTPRCHFRMYAGNSKYKNFCHSEGEGRGVDDGEASRTILLYSEKPIIYSENVSEKTKERCGEI